MQRKIGFQYTFTDKTFDELGRQYGGLTREDIRQLNHKFLNNIHKNSPPELQAQYSRETIPDRKPLTQKSRERSSKARGGLTLRVKELIAQGIVDPEQIKNTLVISAHDLARIRRVLKKWGINIPPTTKSTIKEIFVKKIETEGDDEKLQEFLDSLPINALRGFLGGDSSHETLTTVSVIARKKGFRFHNRHVRSIAEKIKITGIPIRQIVSSFENGKILSSYYVVYAKPKHAERIAEILRNDPDLQRFRENPVKLICGAFEEK